MEPSVLAQFAKHTPKILRRQLILELITGYIDAEKRGGMSSSNLTMNTDECNPSIHRFHGALLFVDISGFTALSLRLSVEDLKNHINEYFSAMLDIVDKHDGDVIKFAGDALFIIWETNAQVEYAGADSVRSTFSSKIAISKAVACGQEISETCGNHKVELNTTLRAGVEDQMLRNRPSMFRAMMPVFRQSYAEGTSSKQTKDDSVAYLNVHSGVTIGLMAGIDIGVDNRWEYFLIGEPLTKVAEAEGLASSGDIVICPEAHAALHPPPKLSVYKAGSGGSPTARTSPKASPTATSPSGKTGSTRFGSLKNQLSMKFSTISSKNSGFLLRRKSLDEAPVCPLPGSELPCGCIYLKDGFCKVVRKSSSSQNRRKSRLKTQLEDNLHPDAGDAQDKAAKILEEIDNDIEEAYEEFKKAFGSELRAKLKKISGNRESTKEVSVPDQEERMKAHFKKWCLACIEDDIARHVHDVVRSSYTFKGPSRVGAFQTAINDMWYQFNRGRQQGASSTTPTSSSVSLQLGERPTFSPPTLVKVPSHGSLTRKRSQSKIRLLEVQDSVGFTAEIRFVTVMFVKIDMGDMQLLVDATTRSKKGQTSEFRFQKKSVNEELADRLLLDRLQSCIEALSEAFRMHGGQIRQFIVDDKGTVCIGTFGLRGAVSDDNAAAALETAHTIVTKLQELGLNSSIGVTVGRAYCGLVGSDKRHEYAVMGPSTNLSARLMGKAPPGGIICDIETRKRDRTHSFVALASIVAKGYSDPVGTFRPEFEDNKIELVEDKKYTRLMTRKSYDFVSSSGANVVSALRYVNAINRDNSLMLDNASRRSFSEMSKDGTSIDNASLDSGDGGGGGGGGVLASLRDALSQDVSNGSVGFSSKSNRPPAPVSQAVSHKIVRQFTRASFFVNIDAIQGGGGGVVGVSEGKSRASASKMKINLYGRSNEIGRVFEFLFAPLVDSPYGVLKTAKRSYSKKGILAQSIDMDAPEQKLPTFKVDQEARLVGIVGPQGIGKTSLVSAIAQRIFTVSNTNANNNVHLFKSRFNSFQVNIPFNAWRPVITEMLVRICRLLKSKNVSGKQRKRSVILGAAMNPLEVMIGAEFVLSLLPEDVQRLKPLLGELSLIPEDKEAILALDLTNQEKIIEATKLLLAILQIYPTVTNQLVYISMEDIHTFDLASLSLLHQVWTQLKGIVILFTQRPQGPHAAATAAAAGHHSSANSTTSSHTSGHTSSLKNLSESGGDSGMNIIAKFTEYFDDPSRYLEIELNQLDKEATNALVRDVLDTYGITRFDSTMINRVYDVCAGNPLYAFELAKSVVEQKDNLVDAIVFNKATKGIHCIRIEEVICHRFDQLSPSAQTILKMASVICSNGSTFTLSMLSFIKHDAHYGPHHSMSIANELPDKKKDSPYKDYDLSIAADLLDILTKETFIRVVRNHTTDKAGALSAKSTRSLLSPNSRRFSSPGIGNSPSSVKDSPSTSHRKTVDSPSSSIRKHHTVDYTASPPAAALSRKSLDGLSRKSTDSVASARLFVDGEEEALTKEAIASNQYTFEFEISLEQFTIYDLLLDDQKQVIHECIAEYYQTRRDGTVAHKSISMPAKNSPVNRMEANLAEEGFHWNRGSIWNSAMQCYYRASLLETDENACNDLIRNAYAMYCSMKEQNDWEMADKKNVQVLENADMSCDETKRLFASCFNPSAERSELNARSDFDPLTMLMSPRNNVLTLDRVFQIFEGDCDLLETGLRVHIQMVQRCMNKLDDSAMTRTLAEDALQILLLTKNPFLLTSQYSQQIMNALMRRERMNVDAGEEIVLPEESYFCINNFEEVCFPILSAFVQNYLYLNTHSVDTSLKTIFIADQYFQLSKPAENPAHIIQAMVHLCHLYIKLGAFTNAFAVFKEIHDIYDAEEYSRDIATIYGSNRVPASYALVSQYLMLVGEQDEAKKFVAEGVALLTEQSANSPVAQSNLRMIATLSFLRRYDAAFDMWSDFCKKRSQSDAEKDQAQETLATLYMEWLQRLRKYQAFLKSGEESLFDGDDEVIDDMLLKGEVEHVGKNALYVFDYLSLHGKGLESVFLEMCELKIVMMTKHFQKSGTHSERKETFDLYCNAASNFARNSLAANCNYPHELLFNKTATILTLTEVVTLLAAVDKGSLASFRDKVSLDLLDQVRAEASQYNFHYTLYVLGKLQKLLHEAASPVGNSPL